MKTSSRFTVAVHIFSVIALSGMVVCTFEYIARSVNATPVVIRRLIGKLKTAGIVGVHSKENHINVFNRFCRIESKKARDNHG